MSAPLKVCGTCKSLSPYVEKEGDNIGQFFCHAKAWFCDLYDNCSDWVVTPPPKNWLEG